MMFRPAHRPLRRHQRVQVALRRDRRKGLHALRRHQAIIRRIPDSRVTIRFYCSAGDNDMPPPSAHLRPAHRGPAGRISAGIAAARSSSKNWIPNPIPTPRTPPGSTASKANRSASSASIRFTSAWWSARSMKSRPALAGARAGAAAGIRHFARAWPAWRSGAPPTVGIMSALPVFGQQYNPLTMGREEAGQPALGVCHGIEEGFHRQDRADDRRPD